MISLMKRFLPFLFILLFFSAPQAKAVSAGAETERYAVAASRDVWFYSEANDDKGLFVLPYTYYVKILSEGDPFCAVEYHDGSEGYQKVSGFCKRDALTFVDFVPERPFLKKRIRLTYTIDGNNGVGEGAFDSAERTVSFYGTYSSGTAQYFYVYADGVFDYVPAVQTVSYDLNVDYLASASTEPTTPPVSSEGLNGGQIAVICVLCVAAVAIAVLLLRGKKPPAPRSRSED